MNLDPTIIISEFSAGAAIYVKIALLVLMVLYIFFYLMLSTKIRSLNKTVFLPPESGEVVIRVFTIFYIIALLSLFVITLVIV